MDAMAAKAQQTIASNIYMSLATSSLDGKPWISPVFFAYDDRYNLFWVSDKEALHSRLIRINPQVAIVMFNSQAREGEGDGVYFEASACELSDISEIKHAMATLGGRVTQDIFKVKRIEEVTADGAWRIYKAIPRIVSVLSDGEYVNGQYVDKRVVVSLDTNQ